MVAVIGTTGVGKSDLAVALAQSLLPSRHAEVLSADSMQLYKGLDVITNKMTKAEMKGVKHWGLDLVTPGQGSWEVGRWCSEAKKEVSTAFQLSASEELTSASRCLRWMKGPYLSYAAERITSFNITSSRLNPSLSIARRRSLKKHESGNLPTHSRVYRTTLIPSSSNCSTRSGRTRRSGQAVKQ